MDLSELKGIINLMQKSDLTELEIELQDLKLRMARPGGEKVNYETVIQQPQVKPLLPAVENARGRDTELTHPTCAHRTSNETHSSRQSMRGNLVTPNVTTYQTTSFVSCSAETHTGVTPS